MTKAHEPTVKSRAEVTSLTSFGITQDDICIYLGITKKTLERHYRYELDTAVTRANGQIANALYTKAVKGGDVTAMIFWLKTRARWRTNEIESVMHQNESLKQEMIELRAQLDEKYKKDY